ncbi:interleukin-15 isoform X5 [Cygnus olor]|uniref:interleukin-15 isoform X5 n=1 Tax=Cygnus olor TaxID=8869 RepID=UPI001ADE886B|nr:interleukin-15 isoform X5 [Cygnus olor]
MSRRHHRKEKKLMNTARKIMEVEGASLLHSIALKTHLKSICLQYHMYLLLNSHFFFLLKNKTGLTIFFLCAYIPKTEADHCKWTDVLKDLEQIKTSKDIDVSLYTANTDEDKECQEPIMRCFFLEMKVILHECYIKNCSKTQDVFNILKNGNARFKNNEMLPESLPDQFLHNIWDSETDAGI